MDKNLQGSTVELERRETPMLIGSDKVEGTAVYRPDGDRAGQDRARDDRQAERQSGVCGQRASAAFWGSAKTTIRCRGRFSTYNPALGG